MISCPRCIIVGMKFRGHPVHIHKSKRRPLNATLSKKFMAGRVLFLKRKPIQTQRACLSVESLATWLLLYLTDSLAERQVLKIHSLTKRAFSNQLLCMNPRISAGISKKNYVQEVTVTKAENDPDRLHQHMSLCEITLSGITGLKQRDKFWKISHLLREHVQTQLLCMNPRSSARVPTRTRRPFHSSAYRGPCPVDLRPHRAPPETKREREIKREAERHTREEYRRDSSGEYVHKKYGVTCGAKSFDKVSKQLEGFPRRVRLGKTPPKSNVGRNGGGAFIFVQRLWS